MGAKSKTAVAAAYIADAERDEATAARLEVEGDIEGAANYRAAARYSREKAEFAVLAGAKQMPVVMGEATEAGKPIVYRPHDTLRTPDQAALDASADRKQLLVSRNLDVAAMALDASASIEAANSLEKMLSHQLALAHDMTFKLADRAAGADDPHVAAKLAGMAARFMDTFQRGLLTVQRLRCGNQQTVVVQHVQVNGGQAVIAREVSTGGIPRDEG